MDAQYELIADALAGQGWYAGEGLFPADFCRLLRDEQEELIEASKFRQAGIGTGSDFQVRPEIRSDRVLWLDPSSLSPLQQQYWNTIDSLRQYLKQALFQPLHEYEAHYAVYPPGSYYKRHIDQYVKASHRIISCILYLNENWKPEDEGLLRIYHSDDSFALDVQPVLGTFVCFRSADIPHEVLPTKAHRYSITGWMRAEQGLPFGN